MEEEFWKYSPDNFKKMSNCILVHISYTREDKIIDKLSDADIIVRKYGYKLLHEKLEDNLSVPSRMKGIRDYLDMTQRMMTLRHRDEYIYIPVFRREDRPLPLVFIDKMVRNNPLFTVDFSLGIIRPFDDERDHCPVPSPTYDMDYKPNPGPLKPGHFWVDKKEVENNG